MTPCTGLVMSAAAKEEAAAALQLDRTAPAEHGASFDAAHPRDTLRGFNGMREWAAARNGRAGGELRGVAEADSPRRLSAGSAGCQLLDWQRHFVWAGTRSHASRHTCTYGAQARR